MSLRGLEMYWVVSLSWRKISSLGLRRGWHLFWWSSTFPRVYNVSKGLPASVDIVSPNKVIRQTLDYKNIPFRCFLCRCTGHVRANCPNLGKNSVSLVEGIAIPTVPLDNIVPPPGMHPDEPSVIYEGVSKSELDFYLSMERNLDLRLSNSKPLARNLLSYLNLSENNLASSPTAYPLFANLMINPPVLPISPCTVSPVLAPEVNRDLLSPPILEHTNFTDEEIPPSKKSGLNYFTSALMSLEGIDNYPLEIFAVNPLPNEDVVIPSIRCANVTIHRKKKEKEKVLGDTFIPLSKRIGCVDVNPSTSGTLRASVSNPIFP